MHGHSKLYKTADGRDLGFGPTGSSAIRSAELENPTTLEPNHEVDRSRSDDPLPIYLWPFEIFQNARSIGRSLVVGAQYIH